MAGLTSEQLAQVSELVGEQTLYLALPQVRGLIKQLSTCETWCQPSRDTDFNFKPPSPLDALPPQHGAELQGWVKVYLGQGHTAVDVKHAFQDLRQHCNEEQHMSAAEDVLQAILQLRQDISMPALKARDPFLHAAMAGAEDFSKCFLAEPRLFWLAYLVLDHCKHSLYHSYQDDCVWQDVPKLKKSARDAILTWTEMVTQNHERLGDGPSDFFASADSVHARALQLGPRQSYPLDQLQLRVAHCLGLGLFERVAEQQPFAFAVLSHMDQMFAMLEHIT